MKDTLVWKFVLFWFLVHFDPRCCFALKSFSWNYHDKASFDFQMTRKTNWQHNKQIIFRQEKFKWRGWLSLALSLSPSLSSNLPLSPFRPLSLSLPLSPRFLSRQCKLMQFRICILWRTLSLRFSFWPRLKNKLCKILNILLFYAAQWSKNSPNGKWPRFQYCSVIIAYLEKIRTLLYNSLILDDRLWGSAVGGNFNSKQ